MILHKIRRPFDLDWRSPTCVAKCVEQLHLVERRCLSELAPPLNESQRSLTKQTLK